MMSFRKPRFRDELANSGVENDTSLMIQGPTRPSAVKNCRVASRQTQSGRRLSFEALENRRLLAAGDLDLSFGTTGIVTTPLPGDPDLARGAAVAVQSDGKVVAAGFTRLLAPDDYDFVLARYNTDGTLDPTFGSGGIVQTDVHFRDGLLTEIEIDSNGKIVVAGGSDALVLARYNTDGSLDTTFDGDGVLRVGLGVHVYRAKGIQGMKIQPNGKIVVAARSFTTPPHQGDFAVARFNEDGSWDTGFGTTTVGAHTFTISDFGGDEKVYGLDLTADGKIVVVGTAPALPGTTGDYGIARYNSDGTPDASFGGGDGMATIDVDSSDASHFADVIVDGNGKIVIASNHLLRLNSDGSLDPSFDGDGVIGGFTLQWHRVQLQADGKIVTAGREPKVARWNSDGSPDTSFGSAGNVFFGFVVGQDSANDLAMQTDGKIVVVGAAVNAAGDPAPLNIFAVARLLGDSAPPILQSIEDSFVDEGGTLSLTATATDPDDGDTLTFSLDTAPASATIDPDTGLFSWAPPDGPAVADVTVRVTDQAGEFDTTSFQVTVNNVAPEIMDLLSSHPTPANKSADGNLTISGTYFDPAGDFDTHTVTVDWGDGSPVELMSSVDQVDDSFAGSHQYANGGIYEITVTVQDEDGGVSSEATTAAISGVGIVDGTLYVIGTDGKDIVDVKLVGGGSDGGSDGNPDDPQIKVTTRLNVSGSDGGSDGDSNGGSDGGSDGTADMFLFDPADVQSIRIVLCEGDDRATVGKGGSTGDSDGGSDGDSDGGPDLTVPTLIEGDAGNDKLIGGAGSDTMLGGAGNDKLRGRGGDDLLDGGDGDDDLKGGDGNDILLGRAGKDKLKGDKGLDLLIGGLNKDDLKGGKDDDILIGANVTLSHTMLKDVRNIWTDGSAYAARAAALTGSGGLLEPNVKVVDDGATDTLRGNNGRDLFFADLGGIDKDKVKDKKGIEYLLPLL